MEILKQLSEEAMHGSFSIELIHHGFLLGLQDKDIDSMEMEWKLSIEEFGRHLNEIGHPNAFTTGQLRPIFFGTKIIGIMREHPDGVTPYIRESQRGRGVGRKLISQLIQRQLPVQAVDECKVVDYYKRFGFTTHVDPNTGINILLPPPPQNHDELFNRIKQWSKV